MATDNAYVQQDKVSISAEVGGKIVAVAVREGQIVKAGDVLFTVDDAPYRIQIAQADAAIAAAQASATALAASAALSGADAAAATEEIGFAQAKVVGQAFVNHTGYVLSRTIEEYDLRLRC